MPAAKDSGLIPVKGIYIYYAVFGNGQTDPVLLLHGGFTSSDYWSAEVKALSATHKVIVMDSRGHGRSLLGNEPLSYELMASDALALMDSLHLPIVSIVGWSDGGIVGLLLAIHHPQRVKRLFTFGTNYNLSGYSNEPPDTAAGRKFMTMAAANYQYLSVTPDSFPALRRALGEMYDREPDIPAADLRTIRCPTTIATGDHEQFIKRAHTEEMVRLIPGAEMAVIPNVGHGGVLQDPPAFHTAILTWLKR